MKGLVPVPIESVMRLDVASEAGPGYQFVPVRLKDGRYFEPTVVSEGCIIQVKGPKDLPFTSAEVESVRTSEERWNFRRKRTGPPEG